jgi:hypothetical protein
MSDFLRDLVGRTLGVRDVVRPRPAPAFERSSSEAGWLHLQPPRVGTASPGRVDEVVAPARELRPARSRREVAAAPAELSAFETPKREPWERRAPAPGRASTPIAGRNDAPAPLAAAAPRASAAPEPSVEPPAERALHEPGPGRTDGTPARATGRPATPSPSAASAAEPEPREASEPAEPPAAGAQLVESIVAERSVAAADRAAAASRATNSTASRRRRPADARAPEPEPEPVVHVQIGRIEVRAPAAPARSQAPRPRQPQLSLSDYLAQTSPRRR